MSTTTHSFSNLCTFCSVAAIVLVSIISLAVLVWVSLL